MPFQVKESYLNPEQKEKLKVAFSLVEDVFKQLNIKKTDCECCGVTKYEEPDQWHQAQALTGAMTRIGKIIHWRETNDADKHEKMF